MYLQTDNFLGMIKNLVTGGGIGAYATNSTNGGVLADGGFKVDAVFPPAAFALTTGVTLVNHALQWAHGSTNSAASTTLLISRDYDQESDYFNLRFLASKAGAGSDTPSFVVNASTFYPGSSTATVMTQSSSTSTTIGVGTTVEEFNFSGNGLIRDSLVLVTVKATGNASAGQEVNLYAFEEVYASCLVAFGTNISTAPSTSLNAAGYPIIGYNLDALGNELR